jgi:anti-sigma B factor antagonist
MPSPTPPRFSAHITVETALVLVTVEGEIDLDTVDELEAALTAARAHGLPVVVDLTGCPFMDSTGLQRLLRHREEIIAAGLRTAVVYADEGTIARLVALVAPGLFDSAATVDAARALAARPPT